VIWNTRLNVDVVAVVAAAASFAFRIRNDGGRTIYINPDRPLNNHWEMVYKGPAEEIVPCVLKVK
jgi:NAD-dependent SIR2 family protein deacetylase